MFKSKLKASPVLCAHWEGPDFHDAAKEFTETIMAEARSRGVMDPLYRLEPSILMVEFIRTHFNGFACGERVSSCYYLGRDRKDVDDSDNGCLVIDISLALTDPGAMYHVEK